MRRPLFIIGAIAWSANSFFAQISNINSVAWAEIPPAVQESILRESGNVVIQKVDRGLQNGQPIYSVTVPLAEGPTRIALTTNGTVLLNQPTDTLPVVAPTPVVITETNVLPEGVTRETVGGSTVYNVAGENSQVRVTTDARVVSASDRTGTQMNKVTWQSLPAVIQNAVQNQTGPGQIVDITQGSNGGRSVYEIIYEQNTQRTRLRLSDTGEVLGQGIISTDDSRSISVEPFIGAQQVPVAVTTTLRAAAGNQPIESVQQEVIDGRVTYVGTYRENGQPVTLRISQTGQILKR